MPTIIGTDTASSISRHIILPTITDQVYPSIPLLYRLNAANKKKYQGGRHIEAPFITSKWTAGGFYSGYDLLDTTPQDTIVNGGWDMKQASMANTVSGRELAVCNTDLAVADLLSTNWEQAAMGLRDILGAAIWGSAVVNAKKIDGLTDIVDDGSVATSYAGLTRSSNTYLNAQIDTTTGTLTLASVRSSISNATKGGNSTTAIFSRAMQYNRFHALLVANQQFNVGPAGHDVQLLSGGATNILFDNIPWIVDDQVPDGDVSSSHSGIYGLNETVMQLALFANTDFEMTDFRVPPNQDAMVAFLLWWGNLICTAPQLQWKMVHVSA